MKNKVLAATYNPVSNTKMFTVMVDIPYVLLPELLQFKELNVTYKKNSPFAYTTCIISGTEWDNFWSLRCPKYEINKGLVFNSKKEAIKYMKNNNYHIEESEINDNVWWNCLNKSTAQPEFQVISEMLYDLYQEADWEENKYHIPFEDEIIKLYGDELIDDGWINDDPKYYAEVLMKISTSMCAKLSYNTQDNEDTLEKHLGTANELIRNNELEVFNHQAIAMDEVEYDEYFVNIRLVYKVDETSISKIKQATLIQEKGKCYNLIGFIPQSYILKNY